LALFLVSSGSARAGYVELGASGSYRESRISNDSFTIMQAWTGSLAYYFGEFSALEVSYTKGKTFTKTNIYEQIAFVELTGMDLIITLAGKEAPFRPYVKVGSAYQIKQIVYKQDGTDAVQLDKIEGVSPSAGVGFRVLISDSLAIRVGFDAWTSPLVDDPNRPSSMDYAARLGVSWIF